VRSLIKATPSRRTPPPSVPREREPPIKIGSCEDREVTMAAASADPMKRWTAKQRAGLGVSRLKGETSVAETARTPGPTVAEEARAWTAGQVGRIAATHERRGMCRLFWVDRITGRISRRRSIAMLGRDRRRGGAPPSSAGGGAWSDAAGLPRVGTLRPRGAPARRSDKELRFPRRRFRQACRASRLQQALTTPSAPAGEYRTVLSQSQRSECLATGRSDFRGGATGSLAGTPGVQRVQPGAAPSSDRSNSACYRQPRWRDF
jgi:hypothetical protein